MTIRLLVLLPLTYALAVLAASTLAPPLGPMLARAGQVVAAGLVAVFALSVAARFGRRDRLRWAWTLLGLSYAMSFLVKLFVGPALPDAATPASDAWLLGASTIALNAGSVAALFLFARVWSGSGLAPAWQRRAVAATIALALAIEGRPALEAVFALVQRQPQAVVNLASSVGDFAGMALIGPVFITAMAMRGGLLVWPWALLFAGELTWMLDDATVLLPASLAPRADLFCSVLATQFEVFAAIAQHWVLRRLAAAAPADPPSRRLDRA